MRKVQHNLCGQRIGTIVISSRETDSPAGLDRWAYNCDCGKIGIAVGHKLRSGAQKSCGCKRTETLRELLPSLKHGHSRPGKMSPEYRAWSSMLSRCYNSNVEHYDRYGGRGIVVCDRWQSSFENFLADMGIRPSAKHSLDRYPDNNGNYEPGNCRWATSKEQHRNESRNIIVSFDGREMALSEAAELAKLSYQAVWRRIKNGWNIQRALSEPIRGRS